MKYKCSKCKAEYNENDAYLIDYECCDRELEEYKTICTVFTCLDNYNGSCDNDCDHCSDYTPEEMEV